MCVPQRWAHTKRSGGTCTSPTRTHPLFDIPPSRPQKAALHPVSTPHTPHTYALCICKLMDAQHEMHMHAWVTPCLVLPPAAAICQPHLTPPTPAKLPQIAVAVCGLDPKACVFHQPTYAAAGAPAAATTQSADDSRTCTACCLAGLSWYSGDRVAADCLLCCQISCTSLLESRTSCVKLGWAEPESGGRKKQAGWVGRVRRKHTRACDVREIRCGTNTELPVQCHIQRVACTPKASGCRSFGCAARTGC